MPSPSPVYQPHLATLRPLASPPELFTGVAAVPERVAPGGLFVALREGPDFDGHAWLAEAASAGAGAAVVDAAGLEAWPEPPLPCFLSEDTSFSFGELARLHRRRLPYPLIAVTGSAGKTTTKDAIATALGAPSTHANHNNLHGAPDTLVSFPFEAPAGVVEIGTSLPGEIPRLAEIVAPDVGLITNIGHAHLEGLGSLAGIAAEKGALFEGLGPEGIAVVNLDDPEVCRQRTRHPGRWLGYSSAGVPEAAVSVQELLRMDADGLEARLSIRGALRTLRLAAPGLHLLRNACAALAVVVALDADVGASLARLEGFRPPGERFVIRRLGSRHLVDDCYNANPEAVRLAVSSLGALAGERPAWACLGAMLELGPDADRLHAALGAWLEHSGLDRVLVCGAPTRALAEACPRAVHYPSWEELAEAAAVAPEGVWMLVKASRGAGFERVVGHVRQAWAGPAQGT